MQKSIQYMKTEFNKDLELLGKLLKWKAKNEKPSKLNKKP